MDYESIGFRPLGPADQAFLWEILYQAIYVPPGQAAPAREIVRQPELATYVRDWGRVNDLGLVSVVGGQRRPVGAAWIRLLAGDERGYGYVDDLTPELSIAILPEARGKGIGTCLLERILEEASHHHEGVSLSVNTNNPVVGLYRRLGFEVVRASGGSLVMVKIFGGEA